jgi:hypothetical protein
MALEFSLGEAVMGGYHRVLPKKLRFASGIGGGAAFYGADLA